MSAPPLILIVEDEMMLAMLQEDQLRDLGYESIKVPRVAVALRLADAALLDAAILDVNLAGELSYPVAESLRRRGVPFNFLPLAMLIVRRFLLDLALFRSCPSPIPLTRWHRL